MKRAKRLTRRQKIRLRYEYEEKCAAAMERTLELSAMVAFDFETYKTISGRMTSSAPDLQSIARFRSGKSEAAKQFLLAMRDAYVCSEINKGLPILENANYDELEMRAIVDEGVELNEEALDALRAKAVERYGALGEAASCGRSNGCTHGGGAGRPELDRFPLQRSG